MILLADEETQPSMQTRLQQQQRRERCSRGLQLEVGECALSDWVGESCPDDEDPITAEPLRHDDTVRLRTNGVLRCYNRSTLQHAYRAREGAAFREPLTRLPFSYEQRQALGLQIDEDDEDDFGMHSEQGNIAVIRIVRQIVTSVRHKLQRLREQSASRQEVERACTSDWDDTLIDRLYDLSEIYEEARSQDVYDKAANWIDDVLEDECGEFGRVYR